MPRYTLELKVNPGTRKLGAGRVGSTFQTTRTTKLQEHVATWSFYSTDTGATLTTNIESIVSASGGVVFSD